MASRADVLELLRPPPHRGPLIAAGAVLFTAGIALEELRLDEQLPNGVHTLIVALAAALILGLGVQAPLEGGRPAAYQSVLLVCGLLLLGAALLELANLLGADFEDFPAGAFVWTSLVLCAAALYPAVRLNSAISGMIAGVAAGVAFLSTANWLFGAESQTVFRWLLLFLCVVFVLASLVLRGARPRHAELMVITAGLAIFAIVVVAAASELFGAFAGFEGDTGEEGFLPGFWELVVLAAGCGLIAYGAVDRVPGAAWLGLAQLVGFLATASAGADDTLLWWPLILLLLGGGAMAAGLRPRQPLPPQPDGYSVERPLASRTEEEITVRVRHDDPPA